MTRTCAFTICAKNYIGLARALERSVREHNPDVDFIIFVADVFGGSRPSSLPENVLFARDVCGIASADWRDMTFKYDIVEFCTSIKPFCMRYLFGHGYELVMYFDPDILVFAPLTPLFESLERHVVVVTPHRIDINTDIASRGGIYNLGFLALRRGASAERLLAWWGARMRNHASVDPMRGLFTDQKWMDHLPLVLANDELFVSRHPGLNYAPWNFDEREAVKRRGQFFVRFKNPECGGELPLVFLHYSAFKYNEISQGNYRHKGIPMANREAALIELIRMYGEKIAESDFLKYHDLPYSYDAFSDGTPIQYNHRRIFKRLREEGYIFDDPFDATGSLFDLFRRSRMLAPVAYNPERITSDRVAGIDRKVQLIDAIASLLVRVIGHSRFSLLARFMIRYLHISNRARLLGPEYRKLKIETF
jgi:hypothetical protein